MGAPLLKVNGFDFGPYLNVQHDGGLDPLNSDRVVPDFAGSPAFREGKDAVGESVDNRAWTVPLVLDAGNRAELHDLIKQINYLLVKGATVEFAIDSTVDKSSFFLLESGRLDPAFQYYLSVHSTTRATLNLWTTPHASTGTTRLIASIPQGSSAVVEFAATGLLGDMEPLVNLEIRVGSAVASNGRVAAWGFHPHPSHNPYRAATSGRAQSGATVIGASGAIGSQYTAIPISPTAASGLSYREYLTPPDAHVGRHRVFAFARSGLTTPITMYAQDRFGAPLGATAQASQTDLTKWQIVDLGEINVPQRASQQEPIPTQYVDIYAGGQPGAGLTASYALQLNGLLFLPLDYSAGVMRTRGGAAAEGAGDTFARFPLYGLGAFLESSPNADQGGVWSRMSGQFVRPYGIPYPGIAAAATAYNSPAGATGLYTLASGRSFSDVHAEAKIRVAGRATLACASQAHVALMPKMIASGPYVKALFSLGPSPYVAIISGASPGAQNVRASAGMPSMLASGYLAGQPHKLTARVLAGRMDVWLATGANQASPVISASHAELGISGNPAVELQNGPVGLPDYTWTASGAWVQLESLSVLAFGGTAVDIGPRETFRFESYPEPRAYQGNASVFVADRTADYRGHLPELVPLPSGNTGRVVVMQGEIDNFIGNDGADITLTALERWEYLR